ncbi:MAG: hypothetical protein ICV73_21705 [Acetobacteraceae bacterium]|nr:hypothetical protein [Acetobacteraceae bacterium]
MTRMLGVVPGDRQPGRIRPGAPKRRRGHGANARPRHGAARIWDRGARRARGLERLLLDLPGRLGFPAAFGAAAVAWGVALLLVLGCLG